jgi:hypothetical protein
MFDDEETIGGLTMAEQGDEAALDYQNPADVARLIQRQSQNRTQYLNDLAEQLKAKRYGPTASERLFALSAAFAAPTSTRGFGGVMSNVMPVFQQFEKAKRDAEEARAADMQKLTMGRMGATDEEIKSALALQKLQATYTKAGQPSIQLDSSGKLREVPKRVHRPKTEAEYAAIPVGEYYVVPSGPDAGTIVPKQ